MKPIQAKRAFIHMVTDEATKAALGNKHQEFVNMLSHIQDEVTKIPLVKHCHMTLESMRTSAKGNFILTYHFKWTTYGRNPDDVMVETKIKMVSYEHFPKGLEPTLNCLWSEDTDHVINLVYTFDPLAAILA